MLFKIRPLAISNVFFANSHDKEMKQLGKVCQARLNVVVEISWVISSSLAKIRIDAFDVR